MSKLGKWNNFVDMTEMLEWYDLPTDLALEYARYRPRPEDLQPHPDIAGLTRRTIQFVEKSIKPFKPPQHNPRLHFIPVTENGMDAGRLYARRHPELAPLIHVVLGYFRSILYSHDAGHSGCTFRKDARRGLFLPKFGLEHTVEWVTAYAVNQFMRGEGVPLPARLFQTSTHWASTFGGSTEVGQELGIPTPVPQTIWGAIMRAADICPAKKNTVSMWLEGSVALLYGEIASIPTPMNWDAFVDGELHFTGYCRRTMQHLDHVAGFALCGELGWYERLDRIVQATHQLRDRRSPAARFVQRELKKYRVTLP